MSRHPKAPECPKCHNSMTRSLDQTVAFDRGRDIGIQLELWTCHNCEDVFLYPLTDNNDNVPLLD